MQNRGILLDNSAVRIKADLFQLILNSVSDVFILADRNLRVLEFNKAAKEVIWRKMQKRLRAGMHLLELTEETRQSFVRTLYDEVLEGQQRTTEHSLETDQGALAYFKVNIIPARNTLSEIVGVIIYSNDITEKKQSDSSLKDAEERWRFALEAANQGVWDWNMKTDAVIYSNSYKKLYGYSANELSTVLSDWKSRIHPDDRIQMERTIEDHIRSENPYRESTYRLQVKDGSYKWILARGKIIAWDNEGNPLRMIGTHTDLTETLKAEQEIRKMNDRFVYAAKASTQALWEWDAITGEAYISPSFTELFGWEADADQRFEQWHQYVHPDDQDQTVGNYYHTLHETTDNIWEGEYRFLKADGSYATVIDKAYILRDEHNKVVKVIGATQDVTVQKNTEAELYQSNERYDNMLKATNELLWEWDIQNNFFYRAPEGLRKVYGVEDDSGIKTMETLMERIHPGDHSKLHKIVADLLQASHQQTFEVEYRFKKDDGNYTFIYDRGILLKDENNRPLRMIGAAQNVSERKRLEQEILQNELEYKKLINQATVDSQEQERGEIGRELHDNINQVLTTTKLYLELALANEDMATELIKKSSKNISNAIKEISQLSRSLMDPTIGDLGIVASLNDLVDNINLTGKIHISLEIDEIIETILDNNQKLTTFYI